MPRAKRQPELTHTDTPLVTEPVATAVVTVPLPGVPEVKAVLEPVENQLEIMYRATLQTVLKIASEREKLILAAGREQDVS